MEKKKVSSDTSLSFILMDVYQRSNDLSDHEFLLTKLKFTVCVSQCKSSMGRFQDNIFHEKWNNVRII